MGAHDAFDLWGYASGQLSGAAQADVEAHLPGCAACQKRLAQAQAAQGMLALSSQAPGPSVDWRGVDEAVQHAAARRLVRGGVGAGWRWALGGALATAGVLLLLWLRPMGPAPSGVGQEASRSGEGSTVEAFQGTERRHGGQTGALALGAVLSTGDGLRTSAGGSATVKLPDASLMRLSGNSELVLALATRDAIALELTRGRVTAQASHVVRKAFVVHAGEVAVHVVGTVFSVVAGEHEVEVAVAEGRVRVELGQGTERFVGAGERLVVERKLHQVQTKRLSSLDRQEFAQLSGLPAKAEIALHTPPPPPSGAQSSQSPAAPSRSRVRQIPSEAAEPLPPRPLSQTPAPMEATEATAPAPVEAVSPGEEKSLAAKVMLPPTTPPLVRMQMDDEEGVEDEASGEVTAEQERVLQASRRGPEATTQKPAAPATKPAQNRLPETVESLFLRRADEGLRRGLCAAFMQGLADVLEHSQAAGDRGQARVLRARCFDLHGRPLDAHREYRLYLDEFPRGAFASEARQALTP